MDDKTFHDDQDASAWINSVESAKGQARGNDVFPKLSAWIDRFHPRKILDIGCGQGICSEKINLDTREYTGIDPTPSFIKRAKELYPHANREFILGNAYELPLPDENFDATFSIYVWHLLSDLKSAAHEMSRTLKTGGNFMIVSANPGAYSLWTELYTEKKQDASRFEGKLQITDQSVIRDVLYLHSFDEIKKSLEDAGLSVQSFETFRASEKSAHLHYLISIQGQKII